MRISKKSFELIRTAVEKFDTPDTRAEYQYLGMSHKRYRWDVLWYAEQKALPERFISDLYKNENVTDDHLDTVLRRVVKPFEEAK